METEQELIQLFEAVKRAADDAVADGDLESSAAQKRCLDGLKQLEEFPVNYHLLVSTQVYWKRLRHLTKHPRKKIREDKIDSVKSVETSESVKVQKGIPSRLEENCKSESVKLERNSSTARKVEKVDDSETSSSAKRAKGVDGVKMKNSSDVESIRVEEKVKKEVSGNRDVRKPAPNGVATQRCLLCPLQGSLRDKIRELLSEALLKVFGEISEDLREKADDADPHRLAASLECALHENWGKSNGQHKMKYRSIIFNLKDQHNPDFRRKVLLGHIKPEQVVNMSPEEMASDDRQRQNQEIKEKALFDCEIGAKRQASTTQFKCSRCGKNECTYYQMQTRSADEPMTTYVTCVNCDKRWKFC
ncbi:Transcription elongation factor [Heracleum sosnowskyi]|uniref:Transcription elongation factor n=1 Tax=Heracleum sosnowskyi TaxID=360622 RepID=A0AAD8J9F9_9APIA|nr:Transcription elongation factor [Heracleum sosnowskyi]